MKPRIKQVLDEHINIEVVDPQVNAIAQKLADSIVSQANNIAASNVQLAQEIAYLTLQKAIENGKS